VIDDPRPGGRRWRSRCKSNARLWRRRRQGRRVNNVHHALQNCHDDGLVNVESLFQFLFQRSEFLSQLALVAEQRAHFEKRTHEHSSEPRKLSGLSAFAAMIAPMLSESIWTVAPAAPGLLGSQFVISDIPTPLPKAKGQNLLGNGLGCALLLAPKHAFRPDRCLQAVQHHPRAAYTAGSSARSVRLR
jgi:hypothetical protein